MCYVWLACLYFYGWMHRWILCQHLFLLSLLLLLLPRPLKAFWAVWALPARPDQGPPPLADDRIMEHHGAAAMAAAASFFLLHHHVLLHFSRITFFALLRPQLTILSLHPLLPENTRTGQATRSLTLCEIL